MATFDPPQNEHPLTDHPKIWYRWLRRRPLRLRQIWCKSVDGGLLGAILKITKNAISPQRFDRSLRNLVLWCKIGFLTLKSLKNSNFTNPRWRMAAILRTVKSPYLCSRLTDFDEIWQDDAYWSSTAERPLKFRIFENSRWRQPPCGKSQKSRYLRNGLSLTDLYEIWYADAQWVS